MSTPPTRCLRETRINDGLDRQVRDLHEAPLSLDDVKGTALSIRRRRRLAVAGGVLAAAAVIVPVGIVAGSGSGDDPREIPPATSTSDPDAPSDGPTTATDGADEGAAASGKAPGIPYVQGRTLHRPDGSTLELPET